VSKPTKSPPGVKAPAFLFNAKDWLADIHVLAMSLEQRGAYITLLALDWREDGIPDKPDLIASILRVEPEMLQASSSIAYVLERFARKDGKLRHPRLDRERARLDAHRKMFVDRAKAAAAARWNKHSSSNAQAMLGDASSLNKKEEREDKKNPPKPPHRVPAKRRASAPKMTPIQAVGFEDFWARFPHPPCRGKVGRLRAEKEWIALDPDFETRAAISGALAWQSKLEDWRRDLGRATPHPATYLHGKRWQDERPKTEDAPLAHASHRPFTKGTDEP
jgi:uncharacterized protein YdaU (DUF1376 family)